MIVFPSTKTEKYKIYRKPITLINTSTLADHIKEANCPHLLDVIENK